MEAASSDGDGTVHDVLRGQPPDMGSLAAARDHGGHDGAIDDQAQLLGNDIRVPCPACRNHGPEPPVDFFPVRNGGILDPAAVLFMFRHGVDEYAAEEILFPEPFLQQFEQRKDAFAGRTLPVRQDQVEPAKPHVCFRIEYGLEQIFLGAIVFVEAAAGHACFLENPRNSRGMDANAAEQTPGG